MPVLVSKINWLYNIKYKRNCVCLYMVCNTNLLLINAQLGYQNKYKFSDDFTC